MPQQEKSIIRSLLNPTIVLDSMEVYDLDTGTSEASKETGQVGQIKSRQIHKDIGTNYPYIEINDYVFNVSEIEKFELDYTGFVPTFNLTVGIKGKTFSSMSIPKDGDRMSVFIRAKNDAFKPIRNDFRISSARSAGGNQEGMNAIYRISGELWVPSMYDPVSKSYRGTSYEVLKEISKELGLGFATNENFTGDSQVWINPRGTYYDLIQEIAAHAWKDEQSFFKVFIDPYYHLNFVNVNNQFSEDNNLDLQLLVNMTVDDSEGGETSAKRLKDGVAQIPKMFTNWMDVRGTPSYVFHYNLENSSAAVNKAYGYKTYSTFFEQNSEQYWSIYTEPLTTPGAAGNKIILKGRAVKPGAQKETFYKTQVKYEWGGIQYSAPEGNCHEKYAYAKDWNERNLAELKKMVVNVQLERGNFNVYLGERIPLVLFNFGDLQYQNIASPPENGDNKSTAFPPPIMDKFYSGYYMIAGMTFSYSPRSTTSSIGEWGNSTPAPGFTHKVFLTRREWPTPV